MSSVCTAAVQPDSAPAFWTTGQIVRQCDEPMHRVEYVIKSRHIQPITMVGNARVFDAAAVERIVAALREMNSRRDLQRARRHEGFRTWVHTPLEPAAAPTP